MTDVSAPMELITPYLDCLDHDHDTDSDAEKVRADCNTEILAAVEQAIRLSNAEAVVSALEAVGCSGCCACGGVVCDGPCPRTCPPCSALAGWRVEVARLQEDG